MKAIEPEPGQAKRDRFTSLLLSGIDLDLDCAETELKDAGVSQDGAFTKGDKDKGVEMSAAEKLVEEKRKVKLKSPEKNEDQEERRRIKKERSRRYRDDEDRDWRAAEKAHESR